MQLLKSSHVPEWYRIPHVHTNYRVMGGGWTITKSLFTWHNETLSIWSMIFVNIASLLCLLYVLIVIKPTGYNALLPFVLLYASSLIHLPFSVGYHCFRPTSNEICKKWFKLDFSFIFFGITILIFTMCYFVLPFPATVLTTIIAAIIAIYAFHSVQQVTEIQKKKNAILVALITSLLLVPLIFQTIARSDMFALAITIGIASSLVIGAFVYSTSILNKFTPTFDLSHTIMHITVLIAHILEYAFIAHCYKTN